MTDFHFKFRVDSENYRLRIIKEETLAEAMTKAAMMMRLLTAGNMTYISKELHDELARSPKNMDWVYQPPKRTRNICLD